MLDIQKHQIFLDNGSIPILTIYQFIFVIHLGPHKLYKLINPIVYRNICDPGIVMV